MDNLSSESVRRRQQEDTLEEEEDDDIEIESDCSAKRTGPHQSHLPAGDMRKKSKMSPASDMNSNSVTTVKEQGHNQTLYNETCLVASKSSGDALLNLVEKAVLRHKHNSEQNAPSSLNQVPPVTTSRYFDKMKHKHSY